MAADSVLPAEEGRLARYEGPLRGGERRGKGEEGMVDRKHSQNKLPVTVCRLGVTLSTLQHYVMVKC